MARRLSPYRRITTALTWPVGVSLTSWRYLWRTTPMRRREEPGALPEDGPPPLPDGVDDDEVQPPEDGVGPLFHRRYRVRIAGSAHTPEELLAAVSADLNAAAPSEFARFHRLNCGPGVLRVGDELLVRMPGPWDGPVRTVRTTPTSFRFATLDGHLEAGQIEFRAERDGLLVFTIESWARAGDRLCHLLYDRMRMAKEVQFHMWISTLERIVGIAGGRREGPLEIVTHRVEGERGQRLLTDPRARQTLDALHDVPINYEVAQHAQMTPERGWRIDDYRTPLPPEPPGPPVEGGSWRIAQRLMRDYEFADPRIVRAVYHPDRPLEGRDMLLEVRFFGLRFELGVRVAGVVDETRSVGGREAVVWGWSYRTLEGHLETGQMDYEVWKWPDSGEVEFRIHVVSRPSQTLRPLVRLGFRLFGRREQRRFARHAGERMAQLTSAAAERRAPETPSLAERLAVQPASERRSRSVEAA
jgi:uncharacterized protein (UPF0548 family)